VSDGTNEQFVITEEGSLVTTTEAQVRLHRFILKLLRTFILWLKLSYLKR